LLPTTREPKLSVAGDKVTLVAMPLTFSIATGLSLGVLSFTLVKLGSGKYRDISPLIWVLSVLFLLRYVFLGVE